MSYLLNIGLDNMPAEAGRTVASKVLFAARAMRTAGFVNLYAKVLRSDSEPTLVANVNYESKNGYLNAAYSLADALGQDCIALVNDTTKRGWLMGPRADNWGGFNPEFFIMLDGSRLSGVAA
jgi:hypothetical protein